jgi:hypothetical protein
MVYADLKQTTNQSVLLKQYIKHKSIVSRDSHFLTLQEMFYEVQKSEKLLLDITDHKYSRKHVKRAVFNSIEEVSTRKTYFLTLDDNAKLCEIRHAEENSDSLTNLLKQQLVVESVASNAKHATDVFCGLKLQ